MLATLARGVAGALLAILPATIAGAQSVADFYKGKTVDLFIGYSVRRRLRRLCPLARALHRHATSRAIPTVVPKNMPGAGSLVLANWLYNVAPKDGTVVRHVGRGTGVRPAARPQKAQFDAAKFNWIGSMNDEVSVCVAWHTHRHHDDR